MVCGNFILPEPASYVFFYALSNLRKLLYIIIVLALIKQLDWLVPCFIVSERFITKFDEICWKRGLFLNSSPVPRTRRKPWSFNGFKVFCCPETLFSLIFSQIWYIFYTTFFESKTSLKRLSNWFWAKNRASCCTFVAPVLHLFAPWNQPNASQTFFAVSLRRLSCW